MRFHILSVLLVFVSALGLGILLGINLAVAR
jgi:hypothetical protein